MRSPLTVVSELMSMAAAAVFPLMVRPPAVVSELRSSRRRNVSADVEIAADGRERTHVDGGCGRVPADGEAAGDVSEPRSMAPTEVFPLMSSPPPTVVSEPRSMAAAEVLLLMSRLPLTVVSEADSRSSGWGCSRR